MQNELEPKPHSNPPTNGKATSGDWLSGIFLLLGLHLIQIPLAVITLGLSLFVVGWTQLIYAIPAIIIAVAKNRPGTVKGLLIGAALTLLLNETCMTLFPLRIR